MSMESPGAFNQASSYSAEQTRRAIFSPYARTAANTPGILVGGILSASDMQLSAPGSGLSVNISTGEAIVGGTEGGTQGGYYARNASTTNLTISTANPTNPRIDTVCVTIADAGYTEPTGVSGNAAVLQVVTGTPTAGATLSNLNGKAALPGSSLLLGYVLVPAAASNIVSGDISNRATNAMPQTTTSFLQLLTAANIRFTYGHLTGQTGGSSATISHGLGVTPIAFGGIADRVGAAIPAAFIDANQTPTSTTITLAITQASGSGSAYGLWWWAIG